jgi:hypothetical protein
MDFDRYYPLLGKTLPVGGKSTAVIEFLEEIK